MRWEGQKVGTWECRCMSRWEVDEQKGGRMTFTDLNTARCPRVRWVILLHPKNDSVHGY